MYKRQVSGCRKGSPLSETYPDGKPDPCLLYTSLCVRLWLKSDEFWNARADIMERTKLALDQAGIRFAGQKIDIVMKEQ